VPHRTRRGGTTRAPRRPARDALRLAFPALASVFAVARQHGRQCIAGCAIETPRLLLSANRRRPQGLANRSGLVGRYMLAQLNQATRAHGGGRRTPSAARLASRIDRSILEEP